MIFLQNFLFKLYTYITRFSFNISNYKIIKILKKKKNNLKILSEKSRDKSIFAAKNHGKLAFFKDNPSKKKS